MFFTFKDEHFKDGDYRKLRDKFTLLKKESSNLLDDGNKSKYGGELTAKFKLLNQIIAEEHSSWIAVTVAIVDNVRHGIAQSRPLFDWALGS